MGFELKFLEVYDCNFKKKHLLKKTVSDEYKILEYKRVGLAVGDP